MPTDAQPVACVTPATESPSADSTPAVETPVRHHQMDRTIRLFRTLADGDEKELRFTGRSRYAALAAFTAWALPRMAREVAGLPAGDLALWTTPVATNLERPQVMLELVYQSSDEPLDACAVNPIPSPRWVVTEFGRGWAVTSQHVFADDATGHAAALRGIETILCSDEGPAWVG